ncbi:MAG: oligosaccharide flippase family protein [Bacteroidales bacterium]|nr:oligosaccharide flippase family protein [Bacteroidales bacterium]
MSDKKRIAKNTFALYVRMIFVMAITLFSSRIVLEKLGVTEFGVYSSVGGVVAMLSFLNATLSTGTSRFITFELGREDSRRLRETFSTAFYTHLILALIVVLALVAGGSYFVSHKLVIPDSLQTPALWTFYISVFTAFISFTQVPYTAMIIANEKMSIYAYIGIVEACGRLGVAYAISLAPIEKLIWYAALTAGLQLTVALSYRFYCLHRYEESRFALIFKREICKKLLRFSGWNLLANVSQMLSTQGLIVLINMFFAPALAAAQAIGNQISSAMTQFSSNFMLAINPQIIKLYSKGEYEASRKLNLQTTVLVWDLMLLIGLPLIVCMNPLIHLWLVDVPDYAVIFARYIVASQIINTFSMTFYVPMIASGQLRDNSLAALLVTAVEFAVLYGLLKAGFDVMWVQYMTILVAVIFGFGVKPVILCRKIGYKVREMCRCYLQCLKSAILPIASCLITVYYINIDEKLPTAMSVGFLIICSVIFSSVLCMTKHERQKIFSLIANRIRH